jgi:hypothetical protein
MDAVPDLSSVATRTTRHEMARLEFVIDADFEDFRARFEAAVPPVDTATMTTLFASGAPWSEMEATVAALTPHDFLIYARLDATPFMNLAGHRIPVVEYLMGNHIIAERMFRHDPLTMLYAPLRVALHGDESGRVVLAIDQPSTVFAGLGNSSISEVGRELDAKLGRLLRHLGVLVPTTV